MTTTGKDAALADWLQRMESLHPEEIELGLKRVGEVAARAGLDQPGRPLITVAGTNGKGSVCSFLTSVYRAAGYSTGTYTSPHLLRFNERMQIDGEPASDAQIVAALEHIEAHRGDISLTYFEYATLAAMRLFQEADVDVIILEVGLGGRLDAVNIWDADVAVVTSISIDHASWLGRTREEIAPEKVAIARSGRPLISGERNPPLSLEQSARAIGAQLFVLDKDFRWQDEDGERWTYIGSQLRYSGLPAPGLAGRWQYDNAAVAVAVVARLQETLPVSFEALGEGIAGAVLPGRLQRLNWRGRTLLLDVAHNPAAAKQIAGYLSAQGLSGLTAVFGVMQDKDIDGVVEPLLSLIGHWVVFEPPMPRAMAAGALAGHLGGLTGAGVELSSSASDALEKALAAGDAAQPVLVFGSFYTLAPVLEILG
ncbi:bifunctional tetrahydrofolate synthase/dihydrofolate synthase [Granulosicoccaceae sp. 1_MG-2023]|nr:bifunctional tetrahydrofolate synthase/dihydrofolate synthase [Granulosicoccaceae sp. 1_MG-2023]